MVTLKNVLRWKCQIQSVAMGTVQVAAAITMATVAIMARQTQRETTVQDYRMTRLRKFAAWPAENLRAVHLVGIVAMVTSILETTAQALVTVSIRQFAAPSKGKRLVVFLEEMFVMMQVPVSDHIAQVLDTVARKLNAA